MSYLAFFAHNLLLPQSAKDKQLRKLLGEEEEGCKSLGVLEADDIKHKVDIKDSVRN